MSPGEIWLGGVAFSDGRQSKVRPVLVLFVDREDVVVATITSSAPRTDTDLALSDWTAAGLIFASTVRLARLSTVGLTQLTRQVGALSARDRKAVRDTWRKHMQVVM